MPIIPIFPQVQHDRTATDLIDVLPPVLQTPSGLAIVEIQGTVNAPTASEDANAEIGTLSFPDWDPTTSDITNTSWQKRVYLHVGKHQRLTGEVKKLPKPLAVLRRRTNGYSDNEPVNREQLEIVEIVYYKLLFAHRPEPVGEQAVM